jgi:hypothetical protein
VLISFKRSQTSVILRVKILNSSVATGAGLTGLSSSSSSLIISTIADNEATATAYTVAASNVETVTTLGTYAAPTSGKCRFREVDATNHKGVYEIHLADARFAVSNAKSLLVSISGATNCAETDVVIPLVDLDPYNATPNANVTQFGGANGTFASGRPEVNTTHAAGTAWGSGAITAASIATGAITAAKFAANAIDAAALATDAVTEIQSGLSTLTAAGVRTAVGLASANLDTQLATIAGYIDTEIGALQTSVSALPTVSQIWTTALTESYRGTNATGTGAQLLYEILANLVEFAISGTTKTAKRLDGSTTAKTYTLDDATTPTSITETT